MEMVGGTDRVRQHGDLVPGGNLIESIESEKRIRCDEAAWRFLGALLRGVERRAFARSFAGVGFAAALRRQNHATV